MAALITDISKPEESLHMLSDDSISPAMRYGACLDCRTALRLCGREPRSVPGNCHGLKHFWSGLNCVAVYEPTSTFSLGESHNAMEATPAQKEVALAPAIKGNQGQCLNFPYGRSEELVLQHNILFDKQEEASSYKRFYFGLTSDGLPTAWKETSLWHENDSRFKWRQTSVLADYELHASSSSSSHPSGYPSHNCPILEYERSWNARKCLLERIWKPRLQDRRSSSSLDLETNRRYYLVDARTGDVEQGGGSPSSCICSCVSAPSPFRMFKEPAAIILQAGVSLLSGNQDGSFPSLMNKVTWRVLIGTLVTGFVCSIARELLLFMGRRRGGAASRILQCISAAAVIAGFLLTMFLLLLEHH